MAAIFAKLSEHDVDLGDAVQSLRDCELCAWKALMATFARIGRVGEADE